jgi:hypothetical protein
MVKAFRAFVEDSAAAEIEYLDDRTHERAGRLSQRRGCNFFFSSQQSHATVTRLVALLGVIFPVTRQTHGGKYAYEPSSSE